MYIYVCVCIYVCIYLCICGCARANGETVGGLGSRYMKTRTNATNVKYADTMCLVSPLKGCSAFTLNPISMLLLHDLVVE